MSNLKSKKDWSYWRCAHRLGMFLAVLFVICFAWYYIRPVDSELHFKLLRMSYLGFNAMGLPSFILGAVQTYLWGYIAVGIGRLVGCGCRAECCGDK